MLLLDLAKIRTSQYRFEQVYAPGDVPADGEAFTVVDPVTLAFDVFKDGRRFTLVGRVATTLRLTCSRCLEGFMLPVDSSFDLAYVPRVSPDGSRSDVAAGTDGSELGEDDLGTAYYDEDVIDLGQLVQEQFYLALPMKPLCGETCRGLCSQCGANLNRGECGCAPSWVDPRFAALGALRKDS
jgi:uncharacterized protein